MYYINTYLKDIYSAEDIMEDVFAELIYRKKHFDCENAFRAYLYKTARNKALNYIKRNSRYVSDEDVDEPSEDETVLTEQVFSGERNRMLAECLASLNDDYREALYLIYFEELSYEQASRVMKKSKKQIDNLVSRAKAAMRLQFKKRGIKQFSDL